MVLTDAVEERVQDRIKEEFRGEKAKGYYLLMAAFISQEKYIVKALWKSLILIYLRLSYWLPE